MATSILPNIWYHRRVADSAAKSCWICYKPSTSVLITPDNKVSSGSSLLRAAPYIIYQDFFYICPGHLKDRAFAIPDADEVAALEAKKKRAELDKAIEEVKREYEEKKKAKEQKRKEKEKDDKSKGKKKDDEQKDNDREEDKKDEQELDAKVIGSRPKTYLYIVTLQW